MGSNQTRKIEKSNGFSLPNVKNIHLLFMVA